jgi:hypothetical protein
MQFVHVQVTAPVLCSGTRGNPAVLFSDTNFI